MGAYDEWIGQTVTVVYDDGGTDRAVTGLLKDVDEDGFRVETVNGPTLIGRRALVRLKLARGAVHVAP